MKIILTNHEAKCIAQQSLEHQLQCTELEVSVQMEKEDLTRLLVRFCNYAQVSNERVESFVKEYFR